MLVPSTISAKPEEARGDLMPKTDCLCFLVEPGEDGGKDLLLELVAKMSARLFAIFQ